MVENKYEEIRERYNKKYVTPTQLDRYLNLGVVTKEQYNEILGIQEDIGTSTIRRRRRRSVAQTEEE